MDVFCHYVEFMHNALPKYGAYASIYPFTTERLSAYLPKMSLAEKSVLTVCGSGDHGINAALLGARRIAEFDLNRLSFVWADLKRAALKSLCFSEYKEFLQYTLRYATYMRISQNLSFSTRDFFARYYQLYEFDGCRLRQSPLFHQRLGSDTLYISNNTYLASEEMYCLAQERLRCSEFTWRESSTERLSSVYCDQTFDLILLSNIADYADRQYPSANPLADYYARVIAPLKSLLSHNGQIVAAYVYNTGDQVTQPLHGSIDDPVLRCCELSGSGLEYREIRFESVMPDREDLIVVLKNVGEPNESETACTASYQSASVS